jgi:hypothetical protein
LNSTIFEPLLIFCSNWRSSNDKKSCFIIVRSWQLLFLFLFFKKIIFKSAWCRLITLQLQEFYQGCTITIAFLKAFFNALTSVNDAISTLVHFESSHAFLPHKKKDAAILTMCQYSIFHCTPIL